MIRFFIRHKKVRGVITVFFTIVYLSVYLMIGVFVDGGRIKMASTALEDIQQIATENIMSQYNRGLYEYYGLFGVSNYSVEDIAKDVQKQIEETMGMKIPESAVKSFILDTATGVKSAVDNVGILSSDGSALENTIEYAEKIQGDISDSNKRFDPYGLTLKNEDINVEYIDLSNIDAMRSQMRDDMRYEALMLPAVSFFDTVNKLMEVANGINTVKKITEKTGSESDVKKSYKEYDNKLKSFSKSLKSLFEETYKVKWNQINSLVYKTEHKPEKKSSGSIVDWLKSIFGGNNNNLEEQTVEQSDLMQYNQIETSFKVEGAAEDDPTGLKQSLNEKVGNLDSFCEVFDDEDGWPYGYKHDRRTENGIVTYYYGTRSLYEHKEKIRTEANERIEKYLKNTWGGDGADGKLFSIIKKTQNEINEVVESINIYLDKIAALTKEFEEECSKVEDKESISIYGNSIEKNLRQWNDSANQRKVLKEIQEKLNALVTEYNWTQVQMDVSEAIEKVVNEADEGDWHPSTTLLSIRSEWINKFHSRMLDLVDSVNKYQAQAEGETQSADVFQLIDSLTKHNDENKKSFEDSLDSCGEIDGHLKIDHKIFDYAEYLKLQSTDGTGKVLDGFKDEDMRGFKDDGKLEDKINGIFTMAQDMVSNLMKALFDNIYDETYILTKCRDYVHTCNYSNNKEKIDNDKKRETDTIFNDKFIKDKSATEYLTNEEFKNIQVSPAEIEYILFGDKNTKVSVIKMYTTIFMLRFVLNYIAALTSAQAQAEATALGAVPFVGPVLTIAAPIVYALAQAGIEVDSIMNNCKKENVWNGDPKLSLFSPIMRIADDKITDLKDTLVDKVEKAKKIGTKKLIDEVKDNNRDPFNTNISDSVSKLEEIIDKGQYKEFVPEEFTKESVDKAADEAIKNAEDKLKDNLSDTIKDNVTEGVVENVGNAGGTTFTFKAGYTDYLLIMLFINGFDKKTQISRLQDIIEANMKEAQSNDFSLANTYSQISVETNSTIKYIFMNQSIMKKNLKINDADYNGYALTIKTAFAY